MRTKILLIILLIVAIIGCKKEGTTTIITATCSDGIQNQGETGVDCGGPCSACTTLPEEWKLLNSGTTEILNAIDFVNNDTGMVGGTGPTNPTLLRTYDGGLTWLPITINTLQYIRAIEYASESNIYLATQGEEIFKSTDNGTTFTKLNNINGTKIYFITPTIGFVTIWVSNTIWKTIDGGGTWTYFSISGINGSGYINKLHFVNNLVGYGIHDIGGGVSSVIKTTDAGATWSVVAQPTTGWLDDIFFTSVDTGYISGYSGSNALLMQTVDGGTNWSVIPTNLVGDIISLKFTDQDIGYASCGGSIYKLTNGGNNWTMMSGSNHGTFLFFPSDSIGYACGNNGIVLKYNK